MKQRLVGTLVLGSLALIVIPLMLDGEGVERAPLSRSIPPAPVFDTTPLPEPERPEILADTFTNAAVDTLAVTADALDATVASDLDDTAVQDEATEAADVTLEPTPDASAEDTTDQTAPAVVETAVATASTEPAPEPAAASSAEPALDASGLPEAWTIRLGSFGNRANADALVTRLIAAGHKAYIRPVVTGQGNLNGVYVGPLATRNEAVALQGELKSRFQISDAIVQRFDIAQ